MLDKIPILGELTVSWPAGKASWRQARQTIAAPRGREVAMKWTMGFVIAMLLVPAVGCNSSGTGGASSGAGGKLDAPLELVAQSRPPIPDLPIPVGFKLDEGKSRSFAAGGSRYIDHVYKGSADKFAVKRFYERHMPICRWVLVSRRLIRGEIEMDFEKETERCNIKVWEGGWFSPVTIKFTLWTSGPIHVEGPTKK